MIWTEVRFGKHEGKTLPQILYSDPYWFFWAVETDVFQDKERTLRSEAKELHHKAKNIKIPNNDDGVLLAEHFVHQPTGKFSRFSVVSKDKPIHEGSSHTFRKLLIDMSIPRLISRYDKLGCQRLLSSLRSHVFGSKSSRLTKRQCEKFFSDPVISHSKAHH